MIQKIAMDLIIAMNAAITNVRLYPPTSALIVNSVERMYNVIESIFEHVDTVAFAESEKSMLIQGEPLSEKNQKRPQVVSFVSLMLDFEIRGISINKGMSKNEITDFLQVMGKTAEEITEAGGVRQLLDDLNITHFKINEQIYVKMDSEHSIVAGLDMKDEDIVKYLLGEDSLSEASVSQIRELTHDPEVISRVFQQGIQQLAKGNAPLGETMAETIGGMINTLKDLTGAGKEDIGKFILNALNDMSEDVLLAVLTQDNSGDVFDETGFKAFLDDLDEEKFKALAAKVKTIVETVSGSNAYSESQQQSVDHVFQLINESPKGKRLLDKAEKQNLNKEDNADNIHRQKVEKLKTALSRILQGKVSELPDMVNVDGLGQAVEKLTRQGKQFTVEAIFDRLGEGLVNDDPEIRKASANLLSKIDERLESVDFIEERVKLSKKLSEWIKVETEISSEYQKVTDQLQNLTRTLIQNDRAEEAEHILEAYNQIYTGNLTKDEAIQSLSANMLQNLATDDILDLLLKEPRAGGSKKKKEDIYSLIFFGTTTVEMLLDRLHDSHNRSERNRVIQVITKMGEPAVLPIIERIRQDGPWFYIRNLVLMMGKIGTASHLEILASVLTHEDYRVQREAVFAIQNIGGDRIEEIFIHNLYSVDDEIKCLIISVLGFMKYATSVPALIELIETQAIGKTKKTKSAILIKSCEALGRIGNTDAIPALKKIGHSKSFFTLKTHDPEVRAAAKEALALFNNKS